MVVATVARCKGAGPGYLEGEMTRAFIEWAERREVHVPASNALTEWANRALGEPPPPSGDPDLIRRKPKE